MTKRKYTRIKEVEAVIIAMREAGKTRREIAEHLGLEKRQIKDWVRRYDHRQAKLAAGIIPNPQGRPRRDDQSQQSELERLRMENKLLRDFLQFIGGM